MIGFYRVFAWFLLALTIALEAAVIRVPGEKPIVQAGIHAATDGDTVLIAEGVYFENINFNGKAITVASYFLIDGDKSHIAKTIIDGSQSDNPDSSSVVYFISGEDTSAVLCGLTITGGTGTSIPPAPPNLAVKGGGGILCQWSGARICHNIIKNNSVTASDFWASGGGILTGPAHPDNPAYLIIEANLIQSNSAVTNDYATGGGIYMADNGRIVNNKLMHNVATSSRLYSAGGGIFWESDEGNSKSVVISGNKIRSNRALSSGEAGVGGIAGGLEVLFGSALLIRDNEIIANEVSGKYSSFGAGVILVLVGENSLFSNNRVSGNFYTGSGQNFGGGICIFKCAYQLKVVNNIISNNSGYHGGGISIMAPYRSDPHLISNTITGNHARRGGGIYAENAHPFVMNTILWGNMANTGPQIHLANSTIDVVYSDIQGGWTGEGNMEENPLLIADSLSGESPCLARGISEYDFGAGITVQGPAEDINGRPRPFPTGSRTDIGAWESRLPVVVATQPVPTIPQRYELRQNYPNPFNPSTTIEFYVNKNNRVTLKIYDIRGREVAIVVDEQLAPGHYEATFDARDFASGIYFYRIDAGDFTAVKKMALVR